MSMYGPIIDTAKTTLDSVQRFVSFVNTNAGHVVPRSYTDLAKLTTLQPIVIESSDLSNLEYLPAIHNTALSLFCGQYLQAVDVLAGVQDVAVLKILDKLNPERDLTGWAMMPAIRGESAGGAAGADFKYRLPQGKPQRRVEAGGRGTDLDGSVNMGVGRLLEVDICTTNEHGTEVKAKFRVGVRLKIMSAPEEVVTNVLTGGAVERDFMSRFYGLMDGSKHWLYDIALGDDIIAAKMKMAVKDKQRIAEVINGRASTNRRAGVLTNNPSLAMASNIIVMSDAVAAKAAYTTGGTINDADVRRKIFDKTLAYIMIVVDRTTDRVRFYVKGQPDYAVLGRRELESKGDKGKTPDIMEIFKAIQTTSFSSF